MRFRAAHYWPAWHSWGFWIWWSLVSQQLICPNSQGFGPVHKTSFAIKITIIVMLIPFLKMNEAISYTLQNCNWLVSKQNTTIPQAQRIMYWSVNKTWLTPTLVYQSEEHWSVRSITKTQWQVTSDKQKRSELQFFSRWPWTALAEGHKGQNGLTKPWVGDREKWGFLSS